MKLISRRQVFTSGAAVLAGTAFPSGAEALEQQIASGPFMVAAKEGRNGSPWVIRGTTPIEVKVSGQDVGGRFAAILVRF